MNTADDRAIALEYLKANRVTFPIILDTSQAAIRALGQYETLEGIGGVPLTYVIDREGKIVDAWYGFDSRRSQATLQKLGF